MVGGGGWVVCRSKTELCSFDLDQAEQELFNRMMKPGVTANKIVWYFIHRKPTFSVGVVSAHSILNSLGVGGMGWPGGVGGVNGHSH